MMHFKIAKQNVSNKPLLLRVHNSLTCLYNHMKNGHLMEITSHAQTPQPYHLTVLNTTAAMSTTDLLHGNQNITYRSQVQLHVSHYFT